MYFPSKCFFIETNIRSASTPKAGAAWCIYNCRRVHRSSRMRESLHIFASINFAFSQFSQSHRVGFRQSFLIKNAPDVNGMFSDTIFLWLWFERYSLENLILCLIFRTFWDTTSLKLFNFLPFSFFISNGEKTWLVYWLKLCYSFLMLYRVLSVLKL